MRDGPGSNEKCCTDVKQSLTDCRYDEIKECLNILKEETKYIRDDLYSKVSIIMGEFPAVPTEERLQKEDSSFLCAVVTDINLLSDTLKEIRNIVNAI